MSIRSVERKYTKKVLADIASVTGKSYAAVVIGVSSGGFYALETILPLLPEEYGLAVIVVQYRARDSGEFMPRYLNGLCLLPVLEAGDKMAIQPGLIYIAPPDYHLRVELDKSLSLSIGPRVNWSRPSVDVLFETAAEAYRATLVGVVLTGANYDGSLGMAMIKGLGGLTVIQDPRTAEMPQMPQGAIDAVGGDLVLSLSEIGEFLATLTPN